MSEHSRFKAVINEAKSFLTLVEENFERVWEDWAPYCVHRDDSGTLCMRDKNKSYAYRNDSDVVCIDKHNKQTNMCIFEDCPYVKKESSDTVIIAHKMEV